jgi:hypothetical protein
MSDGWTSYDAAGNRVRPNSSRAIVKGKEVSVPTGVPAPENHGSMGAVHYVEVHAIGGAERLTFTSATKFKAWCAAQELRPLSRSAAHR